MLARTGQPAEHGWRCYHVSPVNRVCVALSTNSYDVVISSGALRQAGKLLLPQLGKPSTIVIITNPRVWKLYERPLLESLKEAAKEPAVLEMKDGERFKTLETVEGLAAAMLKAGADRRSAIIALGGGVVGDTTGLLASTYMRGIKLAHVPTTLVAQIDSSIGGKTGVNLPNGKNMLGTFYHPAMVLADPGLLATLPEREFRSGLYEALKYGVIREPAIFEFMEKERERILKRDAATLEWLITECVKVKARVVEADEREADLRRILNFGHTIGHALEAETKYSYFLHGEAVGWGMVAASMISAAMQKTSAATAQRIIAAVLAYSTLPKVRVRAKSVARRVLNDKKTVNGIAHFVLPREIGSVEISSEVPERAVIQAVEELRYLSRES